MVLHVAAELKDLREQTAWLARLIRALPVPCAWCKRDMPAGRSDKLYCSPSCSAKAYRANRPVRTQAAVGSLLGTEEVANG